MIMFLEKVRKSFLISKTFLCLNSLQFVHRKVTSTTLSSLRTVGITETWRGGSLIEFGGIDSSVDSLESSSMGAVFGDTSSEE